MFKKVLVANRGEIALRIIRACRELGVRSVAVYSEADIDSMHVQLADEAICIGPGPSAESYLKANRIISAAEVANVDAIHPGYGFLSENPDFAEICESCKIKFIGPSAKVISIMGDKNEARATAKKFKVPVTPGTEGIVSNVQEASKEAAKDRISCHDQSVRRRRRLKECAHVLTRRTSNRVFKMPVMKQKKPSEMVMFILKNSSSIHITSSFK